MGGKLENEYILAYQKQYSGSELQENRVESSWG